MREELDNTKSIQNLIMALKHLLLNEKYQRYV